MLAASQRQKLDESNDALFYAAPRFVTHVDERFIEQLTELYQERLQPGSCILDLMSSWVSHLPSEMTFERVEGHGMNPEELAKINISRAGTKPVFKPGPGTKNG